MEKLKMLNLNFSFQRAAHYHINGGMLLMGVVLLAMFLANSPWGDLYASFWNYEVHLQIGEFNFFSHDGHHMTLMLSLIHISRCQLYVLKSLEKEDLLELRHNAIAKDVILKVKKIELKETDAMLRFSGGDARKLLNILELVVEADADAIKQYKEL